MSFWYTPAKTAMAKGDLDFDTVDLRIRLEMSDTTCDTDEDSATLSGFTLLDEYDGGGYAEINLGSQAVNEDLVNDRVEIDGADTNFGTTVAAGTRQAVGALVYIFVDGTDPNDIPVAWIDTGGFPFDGNGGQIDFTINVEGLLQVT